VLAFRTRHGERGPNALARAAERCRLAWFFAARAGHSADDSLHALLGKNGPAGRLTLGYRRRPAAMLLFHRNRPDLDQGGTMTVKAARV
jgi:hypothetical protein